MVRHSHNNSLFSECDVTMSEILDDAVLNNTYIDDILCTSEEVISYIMLLDVNKASGPDGISSKMLKATAHSIPPALTKRFNISIRLGRFPKSWKVSSVVPIPTHMKFVVIDLFPYYQW